MGSFQGSCGALGLVDSALGGRGDWVRIRAPAMHEGSSTVPLGGGEGFVEGSSDARRPTRWILERRERETGVRVGS